MPGSLVDLVLIMLIVLFAINGYRQGLIVGSLSFMGFFGGALIGLQLAPLVVSSLDSELARVLLSMGTVFAVALAGHAIADWAGRRLHDAISSQGGRRVDAIGGIFVSVAALLLVSWMVAGPLGASTFPSLSREVRNSAILGGVDSVMPNEARIFYNGLRETIAAGDFPNVLGDLTPTRAREVSIPDPALVGSAVVEAVRPSVVKIIGTAPTCRRRIEGSGFVVSAERVMTNAHVVAGTRGHLTIEVGGEQHIGDVVSYEPGLDLAVIYVPGLAATPLPWAPENAATGDDAIVVGFPLDGPYTATSARIRDRRDVEGPDIYDNTVVREVYTIRAAVKNGNSGGPLLDTEGQLLGVIFAAAQDDPETGFALTANEARVVGDAAVAATDAVPTGECT